MTTVYISNSITPKERNLLQEEFIEVNFLFTITPQTLAYIDVYFGDTFPFEKIPENLKWVHTQKPSVKDFPLKDLRKFGIFVTSTRQESADATAEYVISVILCFAKQFFYWKSPSHDSQSALWDLKEKTLLQIGLGPVGTEILKKITPFQIQTWGMDENASFHPYCKKTFDFKDLHSILPHIDIISLVYAPKDFLKKQELDLLKNDSLIINCNSTLSIHEDALVESAKQGKFRGIALDLPDHHLKHPYLKELPQVLLTPNITSTPSATPPHAFLTFKRKLRLFQAGRYDELLLTN